MDAERRNITAPPDWWQAFEVAAAKEGKSLSEWIRDAGLSKLPRAIQDKLSEPRGAHRPTTSE